MINEQKMKFQATHCKYLQRNAAQLTQKQGSTRCCKNNKTKKSRNIVQREHVSSTH